MRICNYFLNTSRSFPFSFSSQTLIHHSHFLEERRIEKKTISAKSHHVFKLKLNVSERLRWWHDRNNFFPAANCGEFDGVAESFKRRKTVEHIFLLKAKKDLSDVEEKDMLDFLYTSQYLMRGIVAMSVGRIANPNADDCTHGVYMRFQRREDLAKFYDSPFYLGILKEHVLPYCHGSISVDYESEVEDDIIPIFRRGEDFEYGVEFVLLISVFSSALCEVVEDALAAFGNLTADFSSLIVQATQGSNFNCTDRQYTHGVMIRFPSSESLEIFMNSAEYQDIWRMKFQPIAEKSLVVHFAVDPVGDKIM